MMKGVLGAMKKDKILILSGTYGEGHQQAAIAIHEAAKLRYPDMEVEVLDFMEMAHPFIHPVSRYLFMYGIKKFPLLHGYLYQKTRHNNSSFMLHTFTFFSIRRLLNLLKDIQPSIVVSTFPFAAAAMSILRTYSLTDISTVTIITDHTNHSYWIHPFTDQYIVGSEQVYKALTQSGVLDSQIAMTGIPIKPEFSVTYSRQFLKSKHGLDPDLKTVLVMGGGWGIMGDGVASLEVLEKLPFQIQLIYVCGRNQKLKKQLAARLQSSKHRVLITGYINYVHELMAISDLMITKPGGLTTSEAIAMQLPMLLYRPLPGQEQDNAEFLLQSGVAIQAETNTDLTHKLSYLLENTDALLTMTDKTKQFHIKSSAFDALQIINRAMDFDRYEMKEAIV